MQFPTVLVINLDHRADRWLAIQKMCRAAGIQPERVSAVKRSPGWHGCGYSHVKCAQIAKERRLPWVLVLEDDCEFSQEDFARFKALLPILWTNRDKWKYFNGGPSYAKNPELIDASIPLFKVNGFTTHFIFYTSDAYDTISKWTPEKKACDVYFDSQMKALTTYPLIARQAVGVSDIENHETNYNSIFEESSALLKAVLDKVRS